MVAEGLSKEVTLEMRWRRRKSTPGREQQVRRLGGKKGLSMFKNEEWGAGGRLHGWGTVSYRTGAGDRSDKALQTGVRNLGCVMRASPAFSR